MNNNLIFPQFDIAKDDPETSRVIEIIKAYFDSNVNSKIEKFRQITHPEFRRFGLGNSNELYQLSREEIISQSLVGLDTARKSIPSFQCVFDILKITHIAIHDVIASVGVEWRMNMAESYGKHCTYLHLVKDGDKWILVSALDRGIEVQE